MSTPKKVTELTESTSPQLTHYIPVHDGTGLKKVLLSYIKTLVSGASATWGSITGTLSNQTDLQSALDTKLNKSGSNANQDVDIGAYALNAKSIKINGTAGNGHISVKHQSGDATASPNETSIWAASDGELYAKNDSNAKVKITTATDLSAKQDTLVSGTNIKTINNTSLLGSGDITIASGITIDTTPITGGGSGRILFESASGKVSESAGLTYVSSILGLNGRLNLGTGTIPSNSGVNNELQNYYSERVYKYNRALTILHKNNIFEMEFGLYDGDYYWYGVNSSFVGYTWAGNLNQQLFRIERTGNVGVNIYSPQARFHIIDTSEQQRTGYDASNYEKKTVGSTGLVTYDAVGSGAKFKYKKSIEIDLDNTISGSYNSILQIHYVNTSGYTSGFIDIRQHYHSVGMDFNSGGYGAGIAMNNNEFYIQTQNVVNFGIISAKNTFDTYGSNGHIFKIAGAVKFEIKNNGVLNISSIPTSAAGLSSGDVWNDSGTLKIV